MAVNLQKGTFYRGSPVYKMRRNKILIVEDDPDLRESVVELLSEEGFDARGAGHALDFFEILSGETFDIAIVDIGLPDKSGFDIVRHLRQHTNMGIVVLTARGTSGDRVEGYTAGADIYFVKPVSGPELTAAVKNISDRLQKSCPGTDLPGPGPESVWRYDAVSWKLSCPQGRETALTTKEQAFIRILVDHHPEPVHRNALLTRLDYHTEGPYGNRSLDVMVARLRKKIKQDTGIQAPIKTVRSMGYGLSSNFRFKS